MSIKALDFAEPFFHVLYLEDEPVYQVGPKSLLINLAARSGQVITVKGMPVEPLKATVLQDVAAEHLGRALLFLDYEACDIDDPAVSSEIRHTWKSLYECSGIARHKGLPYYKSPKIRIGDTELNVCFVSEPNTPSGPHRDHDRNFDEVHAQIRGFGKMQKFETSDTSTFYQEVLMAPGIIHDRFYDEEGKYPWHQYSSITPCVYMPIEIDR